MRVIGIIGIVVLCLAVAIGGSWAFEYYTASIRGKVHAESKIESADSRIQNYNHFFSLCAQIQSIKGAIKDQQDMLKQVSGDDRSRVLANVAGMKAQLYRYVNQYNSESHMKYTKARFKSSSLPYSIQIQGQTTCQ